jgi:hypothetical protein
MKCEDCRVLLEDYFDRALDPKRAENVRAHLQTCSDCSEEQQQLVREHQLYSRYERDVEVTPALWAAIESRIKSETTGEETRAASLSADRSGLRRGKLFDFLAAWRLNPALVAIILVVAVGATVFVTQYVERRGNGGSSNGQNGGSGSVANNGKPDDKTPGALPQAGETEGGTPGAEKDPTDGQPPVSQAADSQPRVARAARTPRKPGAAELIRDAEQKYLGAIALLNRDVKRRANALDPEARTRFEMTLAIIDNTIEETRQAVRKNPGDPIALQYLMASYSRKVDVLREMARE